MIQAYLAQVLLPIVLAFIMLAMGLSLKPLHFRHLLNYPRVVFLGLAMQCLLLPLIALFVIYLLPLQPLAAAGLFLVALAPGGATSNLFSYLSRGDLALSVTLTTLNNLIVPFTLPTFFAAYLAMANISGSPGPLGMGEFPVLLTIKQLVLVTLVPIGVGMVIALRFPNFSARAENKVRPAASTAMVLMVLALIFSSAERLIAQPLVHYAAVLSLILLAMLCATWLAGKNRCSSIEQRTLTIEVGIQNAGTAMLVALSVLHWPELSIVPLVYGLMMNLPAFAFVAYCIRAETNASSSIERS